MSNFTPTMIKHTYAANVKVQSLQISKLSSSDTKQTGRCIVRSASSLLVFGEGVGGDKNKGGSYDVIVNQI